MKKQDDLSVGGALFLSVIFAIMAILGSPEKVCGLSIQSC